MKMTNAEAVKTFRQMLSTDCEIRLETMDITFTKRMERACKKAIAALSPEPLKFPSFEEFQKDPFVQLERGDYEFRIYDDHSGKKLVVEFFQYGRFNHMKKTKLPCTEAGYNAAIAQLNAWLVELINELMGVAE